MALCRTQLKICRFALQKGVDPDDIEEIPKLKQLRRFKMYDENIEAPKFVRTTGG